MTRFHDLAGIDLNLLVAFDALARTGSVTEAAREVGVSQSAMSHTLRRLREAFDDPLFVRAGGRMAPTPRAEALAQPVRTGLVTLERALRSAGTFDPATASRTFRLAAPDLFVALVLPRLLDVVRVEAPGVGLSVEGPVRAPEAALETGELDLAVVPRTTATRDVTTGDLVRRTLFRDGFSVFLRADHPALVGGRVQLELASYLRLDHAVMSPSGGGPGVVDRALAELGEHRRVALRIPGFTLAPALLLASDLVLTAPTSLRALLPPDGIVVFDPPIPVPDHAITLCWHPRFSADAGHRWFREQLAGVAAPA